MQLTQDDVSDAAKRLWDYHAMERAVVAPDFILALGSHDERVARHAAELMLAGHAPLLVTSGGFGKVTKDTSRVSEGERFAAIARSMGVPSECIIVEATATNTGDNVTETKRLLDRLGYVVTRGTLVTKPYMRRRAYATAAKQWAAVDWGVSAPALSFEEYPDDDVPEDRMINLMVGDLQRIDLYAEKGFQVAQSIPDAVWVAYETLVEAGYDQFVISED